MALPTGIDAEDIEAAAQSLDGSLALWDKLYNLPYGDKRAHQLRIYALSSLNGNLRRSGQFEPRPSEALTDEQEDMQIAVNESLIAFNQEPNPILIQNMYDMGRELANEELYYEAYQAKKTAMGASGSMYPEIKAMNIASMIV
jgi:hypothetical protein